MSTLIQRLRDYTTEDKDNFSITHPICDEAADAIENLLANQDAELRALVAGWRAHWSVQPQGADKESAMYGGGIEMCADDLEKWLDGKKPNAELTGPRVGHRSTE